MHSKKSKRRSLVGQTQFYRNVRASSFGDSARKYRRLFFKSAGPGRDSRWVVAMETQPNHICESSVPSMSKPQEWVYPADTAVIAPLGGDY